jgi:hypothetical protein
MKSFNEFRCDAEVGKPGSWKVCQRPARYGRMTNSNQELHYCERHKDRAYSPKPEHYRPKPLSEVRLLPP